MDRQFMPRRTPGQRNRPVLPGGLPRECVAQHGKGLGGVGERQGAAICHGDDHGGASLDAFEDGMATIITVGGSEHVSQGLLVELHWGGFFTGVGVCMPSSKPRRSLSLGEREWTRSASS